MSIKSHQHDEYPTVAHIMLSPAIGGLEQCVTMWLQSRNQCSPHKCAFLICLEDAPEGTATVAARPDLVLNAIRNRFPWDQAAVGRLCQFVADHDIRIVHSHNTAARQYTALARARFPFLHVYTEHGTNPHLHGLVNRIRLGFMRHYTDAWCAVSREAALLAAKAENLPIDRIKLVRNGITRSSPVSIGQAKIERERLRKELNIQTRYIIGTVGRLSPEKGLDRLLQALPGIRNDCTLVMIGDGPQRQALAAQATELQLRDRIRFAGSHAEARRRIKAFDLFVLPSRSEGLSIALLEAMAEGCLVAVTDTGENKNVIDHGRAGFLLASSETSWPAQVDTIFESIHSGTAETIRQAASRRILEHYSIEQTRSAYETIYQQVMNESKPS